MHYTAPHYYKKFHCTADRCPDTCCAGWLIQIDSCSLKKYREMKGPIGNRLHNEVDWKRGYFRQYEGRCAFLNEENLCDLYLEGGGNSAFCHTCRSYPRHIEEFEGLREISLALSCPEAARLILTEQEPVRFISGEKQGEDENFPDFDYLLFTKLEDARVLMIRLLQSREHPFALRASVVLALAHDLQERIDRNMLFEADSLFERYSSDCVWNWFERRLAASGCRAAGSGYRLAMPGRRPAEDPAEDVCNRLFSVLNRLEPLKKDWKPYLRKMKKAEIIKKSAFSHPEADSSGVEASGFDRLFSGTMSEQLMVYFVFTYFCGAVYDRNAYVKIKFALACTCLIRELCLREWSLSGGGTGVADIIRTAYRFSREIEHSDQNRLRFEKALENEKRFPLEDMIRFCYCSSSGSRPLRRR